MQKKLQRTLGQPTFDMRYIRTTLSPKSRVAQSRLELFLHHPSRDAAFAETDFTGQGSGTRGTSGKVWVIQSSEVLRINRNLMEISGY